MNLYLNHERCGVFASIHNLEKSYCGYYSKFKKLRFSVRLFMDSTSQQKHILKLIKIKNLTVKF